VVKQAAERVRQRGERQTKLIRVKRFQPRVARRSAPSRSARSTKRGVLHRRGLDQLEGEMMAFSCEWLPAAILD
jgi:hypothetical protein